MSDTELAVKTPPDVERDLPAITSWARSLIITTPQEYSDAMERLGKVKSAMQRVVTFFRPTKQSIDESKKRVLEAERAVMTPLLQAEALVKTAVLKFQRQEQQRAEDERRKLQAEADEKARREREALEKKAAAAKKPETQERHLEAAAAVAAPVIHVAPVTPVIAGVATRKLWKFEVIDAALVPREFLKVDEVKLGAYARAMKEAASAAGVRFYAEDSMAVKGQ